MIIGIQNGLVTPSLIELVINKGKDIQPKKSKFTMKRFCCTKCYKPMTRSEILTKLGTINGKAEIMKEVDKGKYTNSVKTDIIIDLYLYLNLSTLIF